MLNFVQNIAVIGLGGIGSWFMPPFARFLHEKHFLGDILLVDGDTFSERNLNRQDAASAEIGQKKAQAVAERLARALPGLRIRTFTEYVTDENVAQVVMEKSLVLSAVDNHPARAVVARHSGKLQNICVLSAGNEKWDGNVHVYLRRAGRDMSVPLIDRHPEIAKSKTGNRATLGCEELITLGQSQLLVTNFMAAGALLVAFHALWDRDEIHKSRAYRQSPIPQEIFFDVRAQAMSAISVAAPHTVEQPVAAMAS